MERVQYQWQAEAIANALSCLPKNIRELVEEAQTFHFFCGDPLFAGLHRYERSPDGRSYREISHVYYAPDWQHDRDTIVLGRGSPWDWDPYVIVHEIGHALHRAFDFEEMIPPCTKYAETDKEEAFAEGFCNWVWRDVPRYVDLAFSWPLDRDWLRYCDVLFGDED